MMQTSGRLESLALGQPATQSSVLDGAVASRGVDGDSQNIMSFNSFFATTVESNPWWQVELQSITKVNTVELIARGDADSAANDVQVRVGSTSSRSNSAQCGSDV